MVNELIDSCFYNLDAEMSILGTLILNNQNYSKVSDLLLSEHFFDEKNQLIYKTIQETIQESAIGDKIIISSKLAGKIQVNYINQLLSNASNIVDIRYYANLIIELWQKRQVLNICNNLSESIKIESSNKAIYDAIAKLSDLMTFSNYKKTLNSEELLKELDNDEKNNSEEFITTGFSTLDDMLDGGLYKKEMMVLAARPSTGKTSLAQQIILNAAKNNYSCLFISLESDKKSVLLKFLSNIGSVPLWKYKKKRMNQHDEIAWKDAKSKFKELSIKVNDSSGLNILQIQRICEVEVKRNKIDLIVVDYTQIIKALETKNKNEAQIIKEHTTELKNIAKNLNVAMLALAQVNRKGAEGKDQEPTINDCKGSGGFEEDATTLLILHRSREEGKEGYLSASGKLILAKSRYSRTGFIEVNFDGDFSRFVEFDSNF